MYYSNALFRRFRSARDGVAATEFALLLPVLIAIFFGVVEGSSALAQNRKVSLAVNTLADLAAQETQLMESAADDLFDGVREIIGDTTSTMDIRLISVIADDNGDPVVQWSYDNSGNKPLAPDTPYTDLPDAALLDANSSIMVAELTYNYVPTLTRQLIQNVNFDKMATRWPRRSLRVELCSAPGNCM
ncbi:MAG: pilus assembly protein [Marinicaulis sp.]|nr:pilus assembly protein [Marinicaulis sp.]NNE39719.1 pilus assembly protein [Marinicaulis sp.]NNL88757.1 pilus assembly protein [Marinicaulis sp.]